MGIVEETQGTNYTTYLPTTTIKGSKVVNVKEEHLGNIEEIMIDQERGRIAYAVLSFGGLLGVGNKNLPSHGKLLSRVGAIISLGLINQF
jgi:sporulation protein YlmC with PRC-barrel domain